MKKWILKYWKNENFVIEIALAAMLCGIAFLSFYYSDMLSIMDNSILTIKGIGTGHFRDIYQYSIENTQSIWAMNYNVILCLMIGIWNIPVMFAERYAGLNYLASSGALLWSKGILVVALLGMIWILIKIARELRLSKKQIAVMLFLFLTSFYMIFPILFAVQVDCLAVFFMLLGILYYLRHQDIKFLLCFAIAIPMKMFAILLLVPLILLREKRILVILGKLLLALSLSIVTKLLFIGSAAYHFTTQSLMLAAIQDVTEGTLQLRYSISIFLALYIGICVYCYCVRHEVAEKEKDPLQCVSREQYLILYIGLLVYGVFVSFVEIHSYWIVLIAPFLVLIMILNPKHWKTNVILDTITAASMMLSLMLSDGIFGEGNFWISKMLWGKLLRLDVTYCRYASVSSYLLAKGFGNYESLFQTIAVAGILMILIINAPVRWSYGKLGNEQPKERGLLWVRLIIVAGMLLLPIMCYVIPRKSVLAGNITNCIHLEGNNNFGYQNYLTELCGYDPRYLVTKMEAESGEVNLLDGVQNGIMEQPFTMAENQVATELQFALEIPDNEYLNTSSVTVQIVNLETGEIPAEKIVGASLVQEDEMTVIPINHLQLQAQTQYAVRFASNYPHRFIRTKYPLYLKQAKAENILLPHAVYNGEEQSYSIYMELLGE